ncbi:MAG: hypothetical protein WBP81_30055 [Solirubrobacteraceae bacterium]
MLALPAGVRANETVWSCGGNTSSGVFGHAAVFGINTPSACPAGPAVNGWGMEISTAGNAVANGQRAHWQATAPAGLIIVGASIPAEDLLSSGVDDGHQYGGGFYWSGGGANVHDTETSAGFGPIWSSYFGWQLICGTSPSCTATGNVIEVTNIALYVQETNGPAISSPDGLWQTSGWVRGDWTLHFYGDSPSGLCALSASLNSLEVASSSSGRDQSVWHQCHAPGVEQTINTGKYAQGSMPLTLSGGDAAGIPVSYTKNIYIDNSQPTVSMSGPSDAPSTAGVQYVTATGGGSPSGIDGLSCSADGAPAHWYPGTSAQVPVSGIGQHSVQCSAANAAVDQAGNHGWSNPESWTLKIGEPTVSGIGFGNVVDALRCARARQRVRVPARWVTIRHGHKRVKVRRPARTKIVKVTRCHPRTTLRRVTVWTTVRRHGKKVRVKRTKVERIVLTPHFVNATTRRVHHGQDTTVNGWLGTSSGIALGGRTVSVLSAPDNGQGRFGVAATVTTAANGSWSARLPAGPSRVVEAVYGGGPATESSLSAQVHEIVPAKIELIRVLPRRVAWGGTVHIVGQLKGGYLPAGGALVRLRIGSGSAYTTYGVQEHVTGRGRFSTTYTFGAGEPRVHRSFWFQIASLPMGDYPYAPAASGRMSVLVGGHPAR